MPSKKARVEKRKDYVAEWAKDHAAELVDGVTKRTRAAIHDTVVDVLQHGGSIDAMIRKLAKVLGDRDRAETIGRTESMKAANQGLLIAWQTGIEDGSIDEGAKKTWLVTPDDRLCPICEPLQDVSVDLDGSFDVDGEDLDGPPAHPNCRCIVTLEA